ncbi:MAG TPA: hypothetical protein VF815_32835 [Myxococcaceae bacterium]|jgi:hypothetical protein
MSLLPALLTSVVLAGSPAMRYSSSLRAETFVRSENLTEQVDAPVLLDLVITPRGQVIFYTARMEVKAILEPQLLLRRADDVEVLSFAFLRGEYKLTRGLRLWALESTTYGVFPFEDFRIPQPTQDNPVTNLDASQYMYSETLVGMDFTGIRRTYMGIMGGFVFNGLLDPPTRSQILAERRTPAQFGPEIRALAFHSLTRRFVVGLHLYGRDVGFSTDAHLRVLQAMPVLQYKFHPQVDGRLEAGVAVGDSRPQRLLNADRDLGIVLPAGDILHPTGELSLTTPVPVGYHWPVKAKLSARYVPFVNVYSTAIFPRLEGALALEWKGRRDAQISLELAAAQARTASSHRRDGEERLSAKIQWPLTRSMAIVASGRLLRLREFLIDDEPIYRWFLGTGIVIRQENGRL